MELKFKKTAYGEYRDASGCFKITRNELAAWDEQWSLYIRLPEDLDKGEDSEGYSWHDTAQTKKDLVFEANKFNRARESK